MICIKFSWSMPKVVQEDLEKNVKINDDEYLNDDGKRKKIIGNVYFNFKIRWIEILGPLCCRFFSISGIITNIARPITF